MKRLFLNDIRRGLGKAYIELEKSNDKNEYLDTLVFACTHDCTYDSIFEGPKSDYLYEMIELYEPNIKIEIINTVIASLNINDKHTLIFQKLDLLLLYSVEYKELIYKAISGFYYGFISNTERWTKEKLRSFEIIAIIMDRAFGKKKTIEVLKFIVEKKLDKDYFEWYFDKLSSRYKNDKFINEITKDNEIETKDRQKEYTLNALLKTNDEAFIHSFVLKVEDNEFNNVLNYLSSDQDLVNIRKILLSYSQNYETYLHIKNKLPQDLCLNLLNKYGESLGKEVYDVLKSYKSNEVLKLGLKLIEDKKYLYYGLVMLFTNYSEDYKEIIIDAYKKIDFSFDKYEKITSDTIWFMNHKRKNYPDEILFINYNNSYDSFMREYIFDVMKKRNLLTIKIIEECKYDFDYELKEKALKDKMVFYKQIIDSIHSLESKKFLKDNKNNISNLQWASLAMEFIKKDRVYFLMYLRDKTKSNYEKELFNLSINDLNKYGYISEKTENYYSINDARGNNKPQFLYEEKIEFPIIYNFGDIVTYESNINEFYIVGARPDITSESTLDDYTYLCYSINNPICNDEDLFSAHEHLFACQMNKVDINRLPKKVKANIANAIKVLKNNDLIKSIFKNMKEAFINNVNVLVTNGFEPEITLIDVLGNKYEIIAYSNFIDFYDSDNKYLKLNNIEDIFYYTKDEIVQYLNEFGEDLTGDLKHYDLNQ